MDENRSEVENNQTSLSGETAGIEPTAAESHRGVRFAIWGIAVAIFAGFLAIVKVHTYLGVQAEVWDKDGRDYIWSVWWRARHDMIGSAPSTLFVIVYLGLIFAFVALSVFAVWIALVPDETSADKARTSAEASVL